MKHFYCYFKEALSFVHCIRAIVNISLISTWKVIHPAVSDALLSNVNTGALNE